MKNMDEKQIRKQITEIFNEWKEFESHLEKYIHKQDLNQLRYGFFSIYNYYSTISWPLVDYFAKLQDFYLSEIKSRLDYSRHALSNDLQLQENNFESLFIDFYIDLMNYVKTKNAKSWKKYVLGGYLEDIK